MAAGNVEEFEQVADQLAEVTWAIEDIDLNLLLDDEVRTVLDAKAELSAMCRTYRQQQHSAEEQ